MSNENIIAFYKPVGDDGLMIQIDKNDMNHIAELIDGYPTPIYITDEILVLVDEEAMIKPNPQYNFHLGRIPIYNHVLFVKTKGGEFESITFEALKIIKTFVFEEEEAIFSDVKEVNDEIEKSKPDRLTIVNALNKIYKAEKK